MPKTTLKRNIPELVILLFIKLRSYGIPLGIIDYKDLRAVLSEGFGLESSEDFCNLCCLLWAKSHEDSQLIEGVFKEDLINIFEWNLERITQNHTEIDNVDRGNFRNLSDGHSPKYLTQNNTHNEEISEQVNYLRRRNIVTETHTETRIATQPVIDELPSFEFDDWVIRKGKFNLKPIFPIYHREILQVWRRLRLPLREGALVEADIGATIDKICKSGVASEVIMIPRRRNIVRIIILIDRTGSMSPFHKFVDHFCNAIRDAGRYENTVTYYFHNVPVQGADRTALSSISDTLFPEFNSLMKEIVPFDGGFLYTKSDFSALMPTSEVITNCDARTAVVIISDAGAARNNYNLNRIWDTLAFIKALSKNTCRFVWLNPLPEEYWKQNQSNGSLVSKNNSATQISKIIPMYTLNMSGIKKAVATLQQSYERVLL